MSIPCTPQELVKLVGSFSSLSPNALASIQTYLLCQLANLAPNPNTYEDVIFPIAVLNPPGAPAAPDPLYTAGPSSNEFALNYNAGDTLFVNVQLPHIWVPGTRIYPHIHVQPQTANAISSVVTLQYTRADINGSFPLTTTIANMPISIPAGSQYKHLLFDLPEGGIDMTGFAGPSTFVMMHFSFGVTTVGEFVTVIGFDVHYRWRGVPVDFVP